MGRTDAVRGIVIMEPKLDYPGFNLSKGDSVVDDTLEMCIDGHEVLLTCADDFQQYDEYGELCYRLSISDLKRIRDWINGAINQCEKNKPLPIPIY